jgi:Tfp pilus assembly protein PilE
MPLFSAFARGAVMLVAVLAVIAIPFVAVSYVEWSSEAAMSEFMTATQVSDRYSESSTAVQFQNKRTGCLVGKRELPTRLPNNPFEI